MTRNAVASNLLMVMLLVGGLMIAPQIKQEVFPTFEMELVLVQTAYPGASPAEVEQGVVLSVEEAVRAVDGVKDIRSTASQGSAVIAVELLTGTDTNRALADVKSAVDRVTSFPDNVERPVISLATNRKQVISLVVHGDQSETTLRALSEEIRQELILEDEITVVDLSAVRAPEISIDVPKETLRRYGLTLGGIAEKIRQTSVEVPGGGIKTTAGEVLVRTTERRSTGSEFRDIIVLSEADGTEVRLADIADIRDGFADTDQAAHYNGERAAVVKVFRVGDQTPIEVAAAVHRYIKKKQPTLPPSLTLSTWGDSSEMYRGRRDLMIRNGLMGLLLVIVILGLFLDIRLAFWVTLGIPVSFVGALLFLPSANASINMISMFAFIITLGMVVDDAIVIGEAIHQKRTQGLPSLQASIEGVHSVSTPVIFAVSTTIIAFVPLLFVPGPGGNFFRLIPIVVISVMCISLVESLLILPAHLAHISTEPGRFFGLIHRQQQKVSRMVEALIHRVYSPVLAAAIRGRYLTCAICLAVLIASLGLVAGGRLQFTFLPKVDGDVVIANLRYPFGTANVETQAATQRLVRSAQEVLEDMGEEQELSRGIFSQIGATGTMGHGARPGNYNRGSHLSEVAISLVPLTHRNFSSQEFAQRWREKMGEVAGIESLSFGFSTGPNAGSPIDIELTHHNLDALRAASAELAAALRGFDGVIDIDDGYSAGKAQLDFKVRPEVQALGVTARSLATQVRSAFFGAEAARQQRGRDEVRAYVRLPESERRSEHDIETLMIRTPRGGEIPLASAAEVSRRRSHSEIKRRAGQRRLNVRADVEATVTNATLVSERLRDNSLPDLASRYPGLGYSLQGEQREQARTLGSLKRGFGISMLAIFALLAIVFRSYVQPLIIMAVIPFGLIGAIWGHVFMGYDLSMISMMGMVALSGVVINDSLILIVAVNEARAEGKNVGDALVIGGVQRFRPILLTSLTTFFGLMPMITETSTQARFIIPMAVSLGFGVLLATTLMLLLVPAIYHIVEDIQNSASRLVGGVRNLYAPPEAERPPES
ncbi:MAG: efflux RND transporter permease subunit [Polyangiaceae bacterium]|nr:efflux RND transporter permease subunit [Polyangiaceae bacterium]